MIQKILCITFISSIPFIFSLQGDFVFDDSEAIVKNKDVTSDSWLELFNNDFWGTNIKSNLSHKSYRPLTVLTFRLNYFLSNRNLIATEFKFTNLLCHVACCLLVWRMYICIWEKFRKKSVISSIMDVPVIATLMFGVHPVHVEAVCGIVGRADLLSAVTFLSSFLIYEQATKTDSYNFIYVLLSIILSCSSMFFKETGISVLGVCCIYDLLCNVHIKSNTKKTNNKLNFKNYNVDIKCIYRIISVVASTMALLYIRWTIMGGSKPDFKPTDNPAAFSDSLFTKIATYNYIYFLNFTLLVWPQWLCYDWSMGCVPLVRNVLDFRILLPILLYLYAVLFIKVIFNTNGKSNVRMLIMTIVLMGLPFLPASNILYPVGFVIAERILYIPSIGYCFLIAIGADIMSKKINHKVVVGSLYATIFIYSLKSWQRSLDWRNEYDLFTNALNVCPLNAKVHYNVAKVADAKQNTDWALAEYKEAIRLYPEYYQAMNNLANLLKNQHQYTEAEFYLKSAISYKHDFPATWMNLGIVLANTKRYEESNNAYKTALKYRKKYPDCYYNLGNLYLEMNRTKEAIENWLQAINLNPKHVSAWTNLLALLDNTGQTDKALQIIPKALLNLPETPSINFAIANIYGKINNYIEAEEYFVKAIKLFGDKVQAIHFANLGVLYHRWKKYNLAETMYKTALKIDPRFPSAKRNLHNLRKLKI